MSGRPNEKMFNTLIKKHGSEELAREWFRTIGARGGKVTGNKGFATNRKLASISGRIGGLTSRRGKKRSPLNERLYQEAVRRLSELKERAEEKRYADS